MPLLEVGSVRGVDEEAADGAELSPVSGCGQRGPSTVVMASGGYPGSYKKGLEITGAFTFNIYLCQHPHRSLKILNIYISVPAPPQVLKDPKYIYICTSPPHVLKES